MARNKNNILTQGYTGAIGKQLVLKEVNGKTITTKYPDMSQVEYNKIQVGYQILFSKAVEYACSVMNDPAKKAEWELKIRNDKRKRGTSVYHAALKDFMASHSRKVPIAHVQTLLEKYQELHSLSDREAKAIKYLISQGTLTNATHQRIARVSKATATRDLQALVGKGLISAPAKGAGAVYVLNPLPGNDAG